MARILGCLLALVISFPVMGATLEGVSNTEASSGLKQALADGSAAAVAKLGVENGFLNNPKVKIPLPPALKKVESALRFAGMKRQADDLVVAMNRAAEAAVPEAKALLVDSVKRMTVQDAKGILTGGDTAATDYFKRTTESQLTTRFLPIVKKATDQVGLAEQYNSLAGQGVQLGLIRQDQSTIEGYVTRKALDGLYLMIAEQEKTFRQNPLGASSDIVKRVFGAMR
ncbi:MAG TPA: DUF4197 domain-containing protein [Burkholderiales bacterium]|nr:DUF4197 domain-containing protein [Burkholderiales bacterium]